MNKSSFQRGKIGIDLDDTVWQFMRGMSEFHNREYGTTHDGLHHFTSWHLHEAWGCTKEESIERVTHFVFHDDHNEILHVDGALHALSTLAQHYELVAITARAQERSVPTLALVERLFGDLFSDVHFLGHEKNKGEFCTELGVHFMVDDGMHNAQSVGDRGIPVYLMDRPWNQGELPKNTVRVYHWNDVLDRVLPSASKNNPI